MTQTIYIAGDSTAALKGASDKPMTGWGEYLQAYFNPMIHVDNRAVNGRSTKSFLHERRLSHIENDFKAGDYLFIQFGHNDSKEEDPNRYTDPDHEYRINLLQFIHTARKHGGTPVLLTSVSRLRFTEDGTPDPLAVGRYPEAMREVAQASGTPLLDIFASSQQLFHSLGEEACKPLFMHLPELAHPNYPDGIADNTHFSEYGAQRIARLVVDSILQSPDLRALRQHLVGE